MLGKESSVIPKQVLFLITGIAAIDEGNRPPC
jgi:hypothetical protein